MIRGTLLLASLALLLCVYSCSQVRSRDAAAEEQTVLRPATEHKDQGNLVDTASYILQVEKYADSVNGSLSTLKETKHDVFGVSSEGGEINIYHHDSDTLKLTATYYGESGKNEYQLYLEHTQPVLFISKVTSYQSPVGIEPVKIAKEQMASFVLKNGNVIGKEGEAISKETATSTSAEIRALHNEMRRQLRN
ncbi:hypothetical protein PBAL39_18624 [Pedobacter sp. BAL39]|uniref:hypothetical protein n=1 Tax=Pedobacter sp. BAL39 TaxID=391596 RepID=UPI0001559715|nr:hypothetical protein [Pedobacter sp. BAL39]EDM36917.1 hypothetical protein PBAL39_18624 [Pedobacter sp. BAL39]